MKNREFTPKLIQVLHEGFTRRDLLREASSGLIVGIVALPLAVAFAIASGVSPEKGIITAVIAGLIISALGGSRVQIGGPTGAFIVIVAGIINRYGINGLMTATLMAGIILILMGLFRLGTLIRYIPQTLITGFTSGIAVIIFSTQIRDFFGLTMTEVPDKFLAKWQAYLHCFSTINIWALATGLLSIAIVLIIPHCTHRVPGAFVAIIVTTIAAQAADLPVETISSRFGSISGSIPHPALPDLSFSAMHNMMLPAFSIALLGALESLLSALVADGVIGGRHRSNIELIAQGIANTVSPLFGGIPATGAIARTMTNIKLGGRTPFAGIFHALTLAVIFLVAMPLVSMVPLAALAGILMMVAWNMSEYKHFILSLRINIYETAVLLTTFLLTLFTDLTIAIPIGFGLSLLLFMKRMADAVDINPLVRTKEHEGLLPGAIPEDIQVFEINGPLFFGSAGAFTTVHSFIADHHRVIIFRLRYVPIIDTSGLRRFAEIVHSLERSGTTVLVSGANKKITAKLLKTLVCSEAALFEKFDDALAKAKSCVRS